MRKVHEIFINPRNRLQVVAFIQHGTSDQGFVYENVCPFCSVTIEKVTTHPDAEMSKVVDRLRTGVGEHLRVCVRRHSPNLDVQKTAVPLDTEHLVKEH
jgi:ABC-type molybdate transport system substrate-binding protein